MHFRKITEPKRIHKNVAKEEIDDNINEKSQDHELKSTV